MSDLHISLPSPPLFSLASPIPSPQHLPAPSHPPPTHASPATLSPTTDEAYPPSTSPPPHLLFDDDSLSILDKIYLYSQSPATFHRVYIAHKLPELLEFVTPGDAINYVLPLLNLLAMDEDEQVKEALVSELVRIIWWFYSNCQLITDDEAPPRFQSGESPLPSPYSNHSPRHMNAHYPHTPKHFTPDASTLHPSPPLPTISVRAFTPILGTLLLSPNGTVGGMARFAVVELLRKMERVGIVNENGSTEKRFYSKRRRKTADADRDLDEPDLLDTGLDFYLDSRPHSEFLSSGYDLDDDKFPNTGMGLFGSKERHLLKSEIIWQIVIGMGRLDTEPYESEDDTAHTKGYTDERAEASSGLLNPEVDQQENKSNTIFSSRAHIPSTPDLHIPIQTLRTITPHSRTPSPSPAKTKEISSYFDLALAVKPSHLISPLVLPSSATLSQPLSKFRHSPLSVEKALPNGIDPSEALFGDSGKRTPQEATTSNVSMPALSPEINGTQLAGEIAISITATPVATQESNNVIQLIDIAYPTSHHSSTSHFSDSLTSTFPSYDADGPESHASASVLTSYVDTRSPLNIMSSPHVQPFHSPPPNDNVPSPDYTGGTENGEGDADYELGLAQQASVGRLSSMSLIAAVTASLVHLTQPVIDTFIDEVRQTTSDPVCWVRREVCFALGALAKNELVPIDTVVVTLIPILRTLLNDQMGHVRHSGLFALPAILTRLGMGNNAQRALRKQLVIETIVDMAADPSRDVRSGVLEALGEVIFAFYSGDRTKRRMEMPKVTSNGLLPSSGGDVIMLKADDIVWDTPAVPGELIHLFLGTTATIDKIQEDQHSDSSSRKDSKSQIREVPSPPFSSIGAPILEKTLHLPDISSILTPAVSSSPERNREQALIAFYTDSTRPLICAFNYPALTLALGKTEWDSRLREPYIVLASIEDAAIRRTIAASLAAMARILGKDIAERDLLPVWQTLATSAKYSSLLNETNNMEVKNRLIDGLGPWIKALGFFGQSTVITTILDVWKLGGWKGWREREGIAKNFGLFARLLVYYYDTNKEDGEHPLGSLRALVKCALLDAVSAVREAGIATLPQLWVILHQCRKVRHDIQFDISMLSLSDRYRERMTFVACLQSLLLPTSDTEKAVELDDDLWESLQTVSRDKIVGVRIGVARLVGLLCHHYSDIGHSLPLRLRFLAQQLTQDPSSEIAPYIPVQFDFFRKEYELQPSTPTRTVEPNYGKPVAIFSRPPLRQHDSLSQT